MPVMGWPLLPQKIRSNSGRYHRRAEARGQLRGATASTAQQALDGLKSLISLHGKRWLERGGNGLLTPPSVQAHHRESVPKLFEAGLLRMLSVELDGRTMAVLYALADPPMRLRERRMFAYLIGFDPEFAELSPGTLLFSFAYDTCEAEGLGQLDLLRGGETYKQLWGAVAEPTFGFELPRIFR